VFGVNYAIAEPTCYRSVRPRFPCAETQYNDEPRRQIQPLTERVSLPTVRDRSAGNLCSRNSPPKRSLAALAERPRKAFERRYSARRHRSEPARIELDDAGSEPARIELDDAGSEPARIELDDAGSEPIRVQPDATKPNRPRFSPNGTGRCRRG
jgi:hypothetical protein